jgi:hypothetical protein
MLLYLLPILVFVIISVILYSLTEKKEENDIVDTFVKNILPASLISFLVFIIIKFKDSSAFNDERMMMGGYFD